MVVMALLSLFRFDVKQIITAVGPSLPHPRHRLSLAAGHAIRSLRAPDVSTTNWNLLEHSRAVASVRDGLVARARQGPSLGQCAGGACVVLAIGGMLVPRCGVVPIAAGAVVVVPVLVPVRVIVIVIVRVLAFAPVLVLIIFLVAVAVLLFLLVSLGLSLAPVVVFVVVVAILACR